MPDEIVILGAGPAGMACAMELHRAGKNFRLIEKSAQVGGLAKTYQFGKFRTDNGPHRFFSQNQYLYEFIEDLLHEKWIKVNRHTRFYIDGKFYHYPVELKSALLTMGLFQAFRAVLDYGMEKIKPRREPENFEEYVVSKFGQTLAEFNMLNYTEKIWGLPCSQLSAEWARQRIKDLSVTALLKNALFKKKGPKTLVDQFYYPENGTGLIYETILQKIREKNKVSLDTQPTRILHRENKITEIILSDHTRIQNPAQVVSSIPISTLCQILDPQPPESVMNALKKLRFRAQAYLFLTIQKPKVTRDQWIYFPDAEIPFGRISEMKNFSPAMAPPGQTSLFIEFFCWKNDEIWNKNREELLQITIPWLEKIGLLKKEEIIEAHHLKEEFVYPVYDLSYEENLGIVRKYLDQFINLTYIGRPGRFKYTNQDHSLEMGILAAKGIIEGHKIDVENVGAEKNYFERGYVK